MTSSIVRVLEETLRGELGATGRVALHEPRFAGDEWLLVKNCLDTGWVSSVGAYVDRFETELAARCGVRFAVATVNGTAALHTALMTAGVGPGDMVVCAPLTFVATVNAVTYCGATPAFVDISRDTFGLDPAKVGLFLEQECQVRDGNMVYSRTNQRIAGILPVHIFGHPVDMDPLLGLAARYAIPVIEDAAESLGSLYRSRPCGGLAHLGVLSFNGNKLITTGGGGAVITDDEACAQRARHLSTTARIATGDRFEHDAVGYNYRLPNLNAALGCAQLKLLDEHVERKRRLAKLYQQKFGDMSGVSPFVERPWARSNYWLNSLLFADQERRDQFLRACADREIESRPCWTLMTDLSMYRDSPRFGDLPIARDIAARLANIPSSPGLMAA